MVFFFFQKVRCRRPRGGGTLIYGLTYKFKADQMNHSVPRPVMVTKVRTYSRMPQM